ncbi:MAG: glycosyltransferase [Planctomycetaceae bacterium]|nr:glycosyltransferase [Planctomycetaceae bacterium]
MKLKITILGLSVTSSWGNGHATNFRGLMRCLAAEGHDVLFLERDVPWYAANRDMPNPPFGRTQLYRSLDDLRDRFAAELADSDLAIVGSYVPRGASVGQWVLRTARGATAFYDLDTPVTLDLLAGDRCEYLSPRQIPRYDLYLSFTGGPTLTRLEQHWGSPAARPLYCCVDETLYRPRPCRPRWDLAYLGTYSLDRQPALERLLCRPARAWDQGRFVVAGPQYPPQIRWPGNVQRIEHLSPDKHAAFYNRQRYALNITRRQMRRAGWSPSVRLFEAAACGTAVISDYWPGLEDFFVPGEELLVARRSNDVVEHLRTTSETDRRRLAARARQRVLERHTAPCRAAELVAYAREALDRRARRRRKRPALSAPIS